MPRPPGGAQHHPDQPGTLVLGLVSVLQWGVSAAGQGLPGKGQGQVGQVDILSSRASPQPWPNCLLRESILGSHSCLCSPSWVPWKTTLQNYHWQKIRGKSLTAYRYPHPRGSMQLPDRWNIGLAPATRQKANLRSSPQHVCDRHCCVQHLAIFTTDCSVSEHKGTSVAPGRFCFSFLYI